MTNAIAMVYHHHGACKNKTCRIYFSIPCLLFVCTKKKMSKNVACFYKNLPVIIYIIWRYGDMEIKINGFKNILIKNVMFF